MNATIRRFFLCGLCLLSLMLLTGGLFVGQGYNFETKKCRFEEVECIVSLHVSRRIFRIPFLVYYEFQELPAKIHLTFVDQSRTCSSVEVSELNVELENGLKQEYPLNWAQQFEDDFALQDRDRLRTGSGILDVSIQEFGRYVLSIKGTFYRDMEKKVFSGSFHMDISRSSSKTDIYPYWYIKSIESSFKT